MKQKFCFAFLFLCYINFCKAQGATVVLDTSMLDIRRNASLTNLDGWIYKAGNDTNAAKKDIDTTGWIKFKPADLTVKNADEKGRVEGWFRMRFKLDSSFENLPLTMGAVPWAATDVYIDGKHFASWGNTGANGKPYEEYGPDLTPHLILPIKPNVVYVLSLHLVDYTAPLHPSLLKSQAGGDLRWLIYLGEANKGYVKIIRIWQNEIRYFTLFLAVSSVLCILFWLLYFQNRSEKVLLFIAFAMTFLSLDLLCVILGSNKGIGITYLLFESLGYLISFLELLTVTTMVLTVAKIFGIKISSRLLLIAFLCASIGLLINYYSLWILWIAVIILSTLVLLYLVISYRKKLKGAQWAVVVGIMLSFISMALMAYQASKYANDWLIPFAYLLLGGIFLSLPLSLMVYVAWRFKEVLLEVQKNAAQVLQMSEEKKEQAIQQQQRLEAEVAVQTIELRTAFNNLKATQSKLIQSEKMASLGELTAGIAHEIQNPLNFVNNFSEVSNELIDEMNDELDKADIEEAKAISVDIKKNLEKINFHGKRADAIVKGMLQHSRSSSGVKQPTDINALCDEYLRLSYHGLRAKDKSFKATINTDFDASIGKINIIPQDIGRVVLNLLTNAFYAVNEKSSFAKASEDIKFEPTVSISTKKITSPSGAGGVEIRVTDNGNGIPDSVKEKIFQPFFTTKPTGQGTGLGLSMSYDIVTKGHGGAIKVDSEVGNGSIFVIELPIN